MFLIKLIQNTYNISFWAVLEEQMMENVDHGLKWPAFEKSVLHTQLFGFNKWPRNNVQSLFFGLCYELFMEHIKLVFPPIPSLLFRQYSVHPLCVLSGSA